MSAPNTVVLIHGLWMTPLAWEHWVARYEARGYTVITSEIGYLPLRTDANATDVTVRTEVIRPGQQPVAIDYSMEKTPDGWKAYDVIVAGVSLVTNYRDEFTEQVRQGGIDGLIKALAAKNSAPPPPAK